MKKLFIATLFLAMPLMAQDVAPAQDAPQEAPKAQSGKKQAQGMSLDAAMKKFDKDNDGKLNPEEFAKFRKAMAKKQGPKGPSKKVLEKYDTDKDGKLSKEEREAMKADHKAQNADKEPLTDEQKAERRAKQLAKFDTNKDGYLDKDELIAMRKAKQAKKGGKAKNGKAKNGKGKKGQKAPKNGKGKKAGNQNKKAKTDKQD